MNDIEKKSVIGSKYVQLFILVAVFLGFMFFSASGGNEIRVYQLSGGNDFVALNNGIIIEDGPASRFLPGELIFRKEILVTDITAWLFFYESDGSARTLYEHNLDNPTGVEVYFLPMHRTSLIFADMGIDNLEDFLLNSLHLGISVIFADGTSYESVLPLRVVDVLGL